MNTRRIALVALSAATVLGVAACGSDEGGATGASATETVSSDTSSDTSSETPSESAAGSSSGNSAESPSETSSQNGGTGDDTSGAVTQQTLEKIIATAEKDAGGTAYEIDDQDDDGTWEVDVAVEDRTSVEVTVSADGSKVVSTDDEDDLDEEDRRGLAAAEITVGEAVAAAMEQADGTFDDVELESDGGSHHWEVSLDEESGQDIEVHVDVTDATAAVEQDDSDDTGDSDDDN